MKVLCTDRVDIALPVDRVFGYVSDVSRWPLWMTPVVCAEQPDARPLGPDEELLLCLQDGRKRRQERFEVTRLVSNAFISLEGEFSAARRIDVRFEQRGTQTRVVLAIGYPLFGGALARWFDAAFRRGRVRRDVTDSLVRLKGVLEERVEPMPLGEEPFDAAPLDAAPV